MELPEIGEFEPSSDEGPSVAALVLRPFMTDCSRTGDVCAFVYRALGRDMAAASAVLSDAQFWQEFFVRFVQAEEARIRDAYAAGAYANSRLPLTIDPEITQHAPAMVQRAADHFSAHLPAQMARDFAAYCTFECLEHVSESFVFTLGVGGSLRCDYMHHSHERTMYDRIRNQILYAVQVAGETTAVTGAVQGLMGYSCVYMPTSASARNLEASLWALRTVMLQIQRKGSRGRLPLTVWGVIFQHVARHPRALQPLFELERW